MDVSLTIPNPQRTLMETSGDEHLDLAGLLRPMDEEAFLFQRNPAV
jgi:hypothetical protein